MSFSRNPVLAAVFVVGLMGGVGARAAGAAVIDNRSGVWGPGGYAVETFSIAAPEMVDLIWNAGWVDATFSLFDPAGDHIITNDDILLPPVPPGTFTLDPRITQILAAPGTYSVLVSYCCDSVVYASFLNGAAYSPTDGFNAGSYWLGGAGTLAGMMAHLDGGLGVAYPYDFDIVTEDVDGLPVPEPTVVGLVGLGLAGLLRKRRDSA